VGDDHRVADRGESALNAWSTIALFDGVLAVLIAVEWWRLLGLHNPDTGWRSRASVVGFRMATVALLLELLIATVALHYGSLGALDEASQHGGTPASLAVVVLCSHVAAGVLSPAAIIVTLLGKGRGRASRAVCSAAVVLSFLVTLVLAINSFH
jgi:hypothetical protein